MNQINISIKTQDPDEKSIARWNSYLINSDNSNFYQLLEWQKINKYHFKHNVFNIVAERDNIVVGVLPLVSLKSRLFGHIMCSMPFVNYGSTCADDSEIEKIIISRACEIAKENDAKYLELRSNNEIVSDLEQSKEKVSLTVMLNEDYEVLWNNYKSKHRTNIRRVYKNGVHVKKGSNELLPVFYNIISKSWKDLGTPIYSIKYFEHILTEFKDQITIFVAYKDDTPIAAALNGHFKKTVEGMWLGTDNAYRKYQPSYVLYWEMIKDACERGYQVYHLGRSSVDSGGESFKKKWNAETTQLYWLYYLNSINELPKLNPSNPKYKLAINLWRRLPMKITQIIGPWIAKYIP